MSRFEMGMLPQCLDLKALQEVVILLEPEQFKFAVQVSHCLPTEARQWQTYLNGLALSGLVAWLEVRCKQPISQSQCSILQPQYANVLNAVCHLKVGEFELNLVVVDRVINEVVTLPRAIVDLPEFAAHFYLLVEVQEEQETLIVRGYLRYDQLIGNLHKTQLQADSEWNYHVPLDWFAANTNHLLVNFQFLSGTAIRLPTVAASLRAPLASGRSCLEANLAKLHLGTDLWQVLTWEAGAALLTCPPLLNLVYFAHRHCNQSALTARSVAEVFDRLTQQAVNVWQWSHATVAELAQPANWSIPQALNPASVWRSSGKCETAIQDLIQRQVVEIPPHAYYSAHSLDGVDYQLCAVTWQVAAETDTRIAPLPGAMLAESPPKWALLLILIANEGRVLPIDMQLQVSLTTILAETTLETDDLYLYILVEGDSIEEFVVTVLPPDHVPITLPAFVYHPGDC